MEKQLIEFLQHLASEYEVSSEDYHNIEMWIQNLEASEVEKP